MRRYFCITDLENHKDYLIWQYVGSDILGAVVSFCERQKCHIENMRLYEFKTKTAWEQYGIENFSRIALWQSL